MISNGSVEVSYSHSYFKFSVTNIKKITNWSIPYRICYQRRRNLNRLTLFPPNCFHIHT